MLGPLTFFFIADAVGCICKFVVPTHSGENEWSYQNHTWDIFSIYRQSADGLC